MSQFRWNGTEGEYREQAAAVARSIPETMCDGGHYEIDDASNFRFLEIDATQPRYFYILGI